MIRNDHCIYVVKANIFNYYKKIIIKYVRIHNDEIHPYILLLDHYYFLIFLKHRLKFKKPLRK